MRRTTAILATSLMLACGPSAAPDAPREPPAAADAVAEPPAPPEPISAPPSDSDAEPPPLEPEPMLAPSEPEWPCAADADCVLATRESLGCCSPSAQLEAMSLSERDHIADLCGLHHGGERCPEMATVRCAADDPAAWRAACVDSRCARVPR
jgi:hypothetical protein